MKSYIKYEFNQTFQDMIYHLIEISIIPMKDCFQSTKFKDLCLYFSPYEDIPQTGYLHSLFLLCQYGISTRVYLPNLECNGNCCKSSSSIKNIFQWNNDNQLMEYNILHTCSLSICSSRLIIKKQFMNLMKSLACYYPDNNHLFYESFNRKSNIFSKLY